MFRLVIVQGKNGKCQQSERLRSKAKASKTVAGALLLATSLSFWFKKHMIWNVGFLLTAFLLLYIIQLLPQPVTWIGLAIMAVTGTGLAYFYQVEKERMQQQGSINVYVVDLMFFWRFGPHWDVTVPCAKKLLHTGGGHAKKSHFHS
jgi:hypothetical protein